MGIVLIRAALGCINCQSVLCESSRPCKLSEDGTIEEIPGVDSTLEQYNKEWCKSNFASPEAAEKAGIPVRARP